VSRYSALCKTCGRFWTTESQAKQGVSRHLRLCPGRTPAQRRAANVRDERQWRTAGLIENDPKHPGLDDYLGRLIP
jgi:hypothetical protein